MLERVSLVYQRREMLWLLVERDLKLKYRHSVIGFLWSFVNPLLMLLVYSFAFKIIMRVNVENFPLFLMSGLLPWIFFQTSLAGSANSIIAGANLVKKVAFPREILPLSIVGANFVNFLLTLVVLVVAINLVQPAIGFSLLSLPLVLLLHLAFTVGLSLLMATMNVFFRDTIHLLDVGLMVWFYVTPVIYPAEMVPASFRPLLNANPMTAFIEGYRSLLFRGEWLPPEVLLGMSAWALSALLLGMYAFQRHQGSFAEEV